MMNAFFQKAYRQYKRQKELQKNFAEQTGRIAFVLARTPNPVNFEGSLPLLLLLPLVEIAWADGRVSRREMDAIMQAAEIYGLAGDEAGYRELVERMISRPIPNEVGRMWQNIHYLMEDLPEGDRETVSEALVTQTRFIAEQSTDGLIDFLRGEKINKDEQDALGVVAAQIEKAVLATKQTNIQKSALHLVQRRKKHPTPEKLSPRKVRSAKMGPRIPEADERLIPLVPLVKVAWAEGRITRRERELIFSAAKRMGIDPDSPLYERLASWLDLHPTEDFYHESIELLNSRWNELTEAEKNLRRLDLLSDCVNVAEASGGTKRYPAGGRRVCDEEFAAVKFIADQINAPSAKESPMI